MIKNASFLVALIFLFLSTPLLAVDSEKIDAMVRPFVRVSTASGSVIRSWENEDGCFAFVLTAEHVISKIEDKNKIPADFVDFDRLGKEVSSKRYYGKLLESNTGHDYAIIYYQTDRLWATTKVSQDLYQAVFDKVYVVAAPNGQNMWVSEGVISCLFIPQFDLYMGHSANIYYGSSGSALFNEKYELIGINLRVSAGRNQVPISYIGISIPMRNVFEDLGEEKRKLYFGF